MLETPELGLSPDELGSTLDTYPCRGREEGGEGGRREGGRREGGGREGGREGGGRGEGGGKEGGREGRDDGMYIDAADGVGTRM